jgi:hypothetical protein
MLMEKSMRSRNKHYARLVTAQDIEDVRAWQTQLVIEHDEKNETWDVINDDDECEDQLIMCCNTLEEAKAELRNLLATSCWCVVCPDGESLVDRPMIVGRPSEAEKAAREEDARLAKQDEYQLCPVCRGRGTTVNPNIDCNGLTAEDFAEDPDFAESYFSGMYDQTCAACNGMRVVTEARLDELAENAARRRERAREDGDWEGYSGSGDWRFG